MRATKNYHIVKGNAINFGELQESKSMMTNMEKILKELSNDGIIFV